MSVDQPSPSRQDGSNTSIESVFQLSEDKAVILVFVAEWLGSADIYLDYINSVTKEFEFQPPVVLDMDKDLESASFFKIEQLPTTFILRNREITDRFSGMLSRPKLRKRLAENFAE